ncbi:gliding motility lipoprotein GldH [Flavobacterium sp. N2270]|uniref:gliding motility lipoprotein GldH n=1 Tax=Flavobacterium sp. N2270 TaxID=2986831 RepID=UPI00222537CC|nr:gliding motility lipoprotein GldH [Flavobacterium sp. N2270]
MIKLNFLLLLVAVLFMSCNPNYVFNDFNSNFESNRWNSNEEVVFEFDNENDIKVSSINLHIRHIYDFQFANVPTEVIIIFPNGSNEKFHLDVKYKDETGKELGQCSGDICDLYTPITSNINLRKGKYKFIVKNKFPSPFLPNILGVGILIEK